MTSDPAPTEAPFITFYSFKGGVGRSLALMNVAGILAGRGLRVLVLDMDLEAPGVSYVVRGAEPGPGFVELMTEARELGEASDFFSLETAEIIARYTRPYDIPDALRVAEDGELRVLPAGRLDGSYQGRLDKLDLAGLYRDGRGRPLLLEYKYTLQHSGLFDLVLIDSRTGFSDESGICTRDLADHVFVVMGLNGQNVQGTASFLRALRAAKTDATLRVVLSPVPNGEDDLVDERVGEATIALREAWGAEVPLDLQIPYHPRLALTEEPLVFRRARGHLFDAYVRLKDAVLAAIGCSRHEVWVRVSNAGVGAVGAPVDAEARVRELARWGRYLEDTDSNWYGPLVRDLVSYVARKATPELQELLVGALPRNSSSLKVLAVELWWANSPSAASAYDKVLRGEPGATALTNFAILLWRHLGDLDRAEVLFDRAVTLGNASTDYACERAQFLWRARNDFDRARREYERALTVNASDPATLGDLAALLVESSNDLDAAGVLVGSALVAHPEDVEAIATYVSFLNAAHRDHEPGRALLTALLPFRKRVGESALCSFAGANALLGSVEHLANLWRQRESLHPRYKGELSFYAYVHMPDQRTNALSDLRRALPGPGVPPRRWLSAHVKAARAAGHPAPDLVAALAAVLDGTVHFSTLDAFPEWTEAGRPA